LLKRFNIFFIIFLSLIFILSSAVSAQDDSLFKIGFVTDTVGLNDNSYNDQVWEGLKKVESEFDIEIKVLESELMTDYLPNLTQLAEENFDLIWAVGYTMKDSVREAARLYKDKSFVIVDSELEAENVLSINFALEEAAFLAGTAAALKSSNEKIAFLAGRENEVLKKYELGFKSGVKAVNNEIEISVSYLESFHSPVEAVNNALKLYNNGADVIFHAVGAGAKLIIDKAAENNFYVIGAENFASELAPEHILTNIKKNISYITEFESENFLSAEFSHGIKTYDIRSGGISINQKQLENIMNEEEIKKINNYKRFIIQGEIDIPISD